MNAFLAMLLVAAGPSVGDRVYTANQTSNTVSVVDPVKNRAYTIFKYLDDLDPKEIDAQADDDGGPPFLRFELEAQDLFDGWRTALEAKVRAPELNPLIESHLAKYRSLMPSLALLPDGVAAIFYDRRADRSGFDVYLAGVRDLGRQLALYSNRRLSRRRIAAEHGIGKMKVWRIAGERYRNPVRRHTLVIKNVAGLHNLMFS